MDYKTLKAQIFALGFENENRYKDSADIIPFAVNRALTIITTELRPIRGKRLLSHNPPKNTLSETSYEYSAKDLLTIKSENAKAYAFLCDGNGTFTVCDDEKEETFTMIGDGEYKLYRGFCKGEVGIIFSGDYSYRVKGMGIYDEQNSEDINDVSPYLEYVEYDFKKFDERFLCFEDKCLRDEDGNYSNVNEYKVEDISILCLPRSIVGEYRVHYKMLPEQVSTDTPDEYVLETDEEVCALIPLLASYFVWLDDDPTKAAIYRNEYEGVRNSILLREVKTVANVSGGVLCL